VWVSLTERGVSLFARSTAAELTVVARTARYDREYLILTD
jgi:hypothetical protein